MKKFTFLFLLVSMSFSLSAQTFTKDDFKTPNGKELSIYFIKHSSLIIKYEGELVYVDPVSMFADFSKQPKADVILITHEHADHFDTTAVAQLSTKNTIIILNEATQKLLGKGHAIKNGQSLQIPRGLVSAVPAYNTTPEHLIYHPKGRDNGYVLTIDGMKIYIAGDTENIPEMKQLQDIDIAFLPVNQPYTMTAEQAVSAAKIIQPKILYPYHYNDTDVSEIAKQLKGSGIDVRIRSME